MIRGGLRQRMSKAVSKLAPKLALGAGALLLAAALPSSVVAIGLIDTDATFGARDIAASFTPASADPQLSEMVAKRSGGKIPLMRFTPASSNAARNNRSVTVAVRVDQKVAQAMSARNPAAGTRELANSDLGLRLAPTRYNLGLARGFGSAPGRPHPTIAVLKPSCEDPCAALCPDWRSP